MSFICFVVYTWELIRNWVPRSLLGFFWPILNYLLLLIIKSFFLTSFFSKQIENYSAYLLFTLIAWGVISGAFSTNVTKLAESKPLLMHRPNLDFLIMGSYGGVDFFLSVIKLILALMLCTFLLGVPLDFIDICISFYGIAALILFAYSMAYSIGVFFLKYRDIAPAIRFLSGLMYFALPILYFEKVEGAPEFIYEINPLYYFVVLVRAPIVSVQNLFEVLVLVSTFVFCSVVMAVSVRRFLFKKFVVYL